MKDVGEGEEQGVEGSLGGFAKESFQLGKEVFNGVEIRGVRRQEEQGGAAGFDGLAHASDLVAAEVIGHDDVAGGESWTKDGSDIFQKSFSVHRPVQKPGSLHAIVAQGGDEGAGLPVTMGDAGHAAFSLLRPAGPACHIGGDAGFIQEDQLAACQAGLIATPRFARQPHVLAFLLAGVQRFF